MTFEKTSLNRQLKDYMPQKRLCLVVGLGNPGDAYKQTRHNTGFMVVDEIADYFSISLNKSKFDTLFGRGFINSVAAVIVKPMAFMNRSGPPVYQIAKYFKIPSKDILVIQDDIDLALGRLKIQAQGGSGGHKGIRSLIDVFGGGDFIRLRIGIGRGITNSGTEKNVTDHVLGRFNSDEIMLWDQTISTARDAAISILCKGTKETMNSFNKN